MNTSPYGPAGERRASTGAVDVLVVGAGITGIYQLYRAREAGFSVALLESGAGVGGTWYWNRYPGARFDSESYTYGYLFSKELFCEWEWQEHFAPQPETERYLNHVVDRFDLRRHMRFGTRVDSAEYDEESGTWRVAAGGTEVEARFLIAATGVLSVPYTPDVPGRDDFRGDSYHTGLWPDTPVDFLGKRVAVVGTSSSGVQIVPAIADQVASLTVYQRTANWCTPLNNVPIDPEKQARLRADFEQVREILDTSVHGFLHPPNQRTAFEDPEDERRRFYEEMWNSPGFAKLTSNYSDLLSNPEANAEWCEFIAGKIRGIVQDPETAERLIPRDHRFGEKRPPFVTGYYEVFNRPNVSLVDLRETPIVRVTPTGIETTDAAREFDIIVWATGFDFGTGALARMGIRGSRRSGTGGLLGGRSPYLSRGTDPRLPQPLLPRRPPRRRGQQSRATTATRSTSSPTCSCTRGTTASRSSRSRSEPRSAGPTWSNRGAASPFSFGEKSYFFGTNIPGKPVAVPAQFRTAGPSSSRSSRTWSPTDYDTFELSRAIEPAGSST